jgi:hypothetical protein
MISLIKQIPTQDAALANTLNTCIDNFEYGKIFGSIPFLQIYPTRWKPVAIQTCVRMRGLQSKPA